MPLETTCAKPIPAHMIACANSPFAQNKFPRNKAKAWVRRGKAVIINDVLHFFEEFRAAIQRQVDNHHMDRLENEHYEAMLDLEQSRGKRATGSIGVWTGGGRISRMAGSPEAHTMQMKRVWPIEQLMQES